MTNTNVLPPSKRPALLWGLVCLVMAAALLILLPQSRLNSSVLAMLPKQVMGDIPPALNDGFMQRLDRQLVWLVSPGKEANPRVAQEWLTLLQKSAALGDVKGPMDAASQQSWGAFFWQHRNGLIDPDTRARLQNGGEAQAQWILSQLYSAFSRVSGKGAAKRSADVNARLAAGDGEKRPAFAADGRLAGDAGSPGQLLVSAAR